MNHGVQRGWQNSESSCISKVLFSVQRNLRAVKTGHWKGCHGSERRLKQCVCARENPPHMNRSVRRPTNPETKNWQHSDSFLSAYLSIPLRSQETQDTRAMVMTIIVFLMGKILFILTGRCRRLTSPAGAENKTTTQQKSVYIDYRKGAQGSCAEQSRSEIQTKGNTKKNEKNKQKSHKTKNLYPYACLCHSVYRHGNRKLGRG